MRRLAGSYVFDGRRYGQQLALIGHIKGCNGKVLTQIDIEVDSIADNDPIRAQVLLGCLKSGYRAASTVRRRIPPVDRRDAALKLKLKLKLMVA